MVSPVRFWLSALSAKYKAEHAGIVQLVEHLLAKEKVTGSSPVARSFLCMYGDVAKWQGKGLQNPDHGFKSRRRL
jgi:hypothetical protein